MAERQQHPLDKHSDAKTPNVRSASQRKLGKDGNSFTPSEQRKRDRLMRQFSKRAKGYAVGVSEAFREGYDGIDWSRGATAEDLKSCGGKG